MAEAPIVTCREEGGYYTPDRDPHAPIRIYEDGRLVDEFLGGVVRTIIGSDELASIVAQAQTNRELGLV